MATVEIDPAAPAADAKWLHAMAWQGGGSRLVELREVAPGVYRTAEPLPVHGDWKAMVRLHTGTAILAMPVYLPEDPGIPAREVPAEPRFERAFQLDSEVLRREETRRRGVAERRRLRHPGRGRARLAGGDPRRGHPLRAPGRRDRRLTLCRRRNRLAALAV